MRRARVGFDCEVAAADVHPDNLDPRVVDATDGEGALQLELQRDGERQRRRRAEAEGDLAGASATFCP